MIRFSKPCDDCGGTGGADTCVQCETPWGDKRYCCSPESWAAFKPCPSCVGGWLPDDDTVEAAARATQEIDRGTRQNPREDWRSLGEIQDFYRVLAREALVAAARYQSERVEA